MCDEPMERGVPKARNQETKPPPDWANERRGLLTVFCLIAGLVLLAQSSPRGTLSPGGGGRTGPSTLVAPSHHAALVLDPATGEQRIHTLGTSRSGFQAFTTPLRGAPGQVVGQAPEGTIAWVSARPSIDRTLGPLWCVRLPDAGVRTTIIPGTAPDPAALQTMQDTASDHAAIWLDHWRRSLRFVGLPGGALLDLPSLLGVTLGVLALGITARLAWRHRREIVANERRHAGLCAACGYRLLDAQTRCPECGLERAPTPDA
ncbi:MAG: hypothetical protein EA378_11750 [Phycisphaerales bacterium]|nr:MAG: hypothetical protein EA378_11750 [Phycisphaerales bacterium]